MNQDYFTTNWIPFGSSQLSETSEVVLEAMKEKLCKGTLQEPTEEDMERNPRMKSNKRILFEMEANSETNVRDVTYRNWK